MKQARELESMWDTLRGADDTAFAFLFSTEDGESIPADVQSTATGM
jgi:hypothetical protein